MEISEISSTVYIAQRIGLTIAGQNDYCDTISIAKSTIAILLLLQVPIAVLLRQLLGTLFA